MAAYGPNAGIVPFTGFSPTLGVSDAIVPQTSGQVQFNGVNQGDDTLSKVLFTRGNRVLRRLLQTLIGAASGGTATETQTRVQANVASGSITTNGGLVPIETINQINRVTTATDISNLNAALTRSPTLTFPTEASGTSGGGKLGF